MFKNSSLLFFKSAYVLCPISIVVVVENQDLKCIQSKQKNLNIKSVKFLTHNVTLIIHDYDEIFSFSFQI